MAATGFFFISWVYGPRPTYMPQGAKGELQQVGYDGETIAFVEIRTRTVRDGSFSGLPELSVGYAKQSTLVHTAQRFLADRHLHDNIRIGRKSGCTKTLSARNCAATDNFWRFVALNGDTIRSANCSVSYLCLATKAVQFSNSVSGGQQRFGCVWALSLSN